MATPSSSTLATYISGFRVESWSSRTASLLGAGGRIDRTGAPFSRCSRMRFRSATAPSESFSRPGTARVPIQCPLQRRQVGECELGVHGGDVPGRVDAPRHMGDIRILEAPDHVSDGLRLPDVGEELVAEALALGCPLDQTCDVDELHRGGNHRTRFRRSPRCGRDGDRARRRPRHSDRSWRRGSWRRRPLPRCSALKRVDLPTLGRPTMPHLKPMGALRKGEGSAGG